MKEAMKDFSLFLPGITLILLGLLVVVFPVLLVALVAAAFMLTGVAAIALARRQRQWLRGHGWRVVREAADWEGQDWLGRVYLWRKW